VKFSLSIVDFLILSLALQGLVLSALLFYSSKKINSNRWLGSFIFLVAYLTVAMVVFTSGMANNHPWLYFVVPQLRMALGPLLYFYTRGLLFGDKKLARKDYFHFTPLMLEAGPQIAFIFHFSGLLLIPAIKIMYLRFEPQMFRFEQSNFSNLPSFISFIVYAALCYKMVVDNQSGSQLQTFKLRDLRWIKNLLHLLFSLTFIWLITIIIGFASAGHSPWNFYLLYIPLVLFIYWLGISAYLRQAKMTPVDILDYNKPAVKIYFSEAEADIYQSKLIHLIETERLYLDPLLKLDILATKLSLPEKNLSNLLNQHLGKNFNDFINEYRVQVAQIKLADPAFNKFTIAAIAYDCGFNSLATFQRSFKQFTGVTPSQYQNNLKSVTQSANYTQIPI
jgi:AraC-like DNA-binding protein